MCCKSALSWEGARSCRYNMLLVPNLSKYLLYLLKCFPGPFVSRMIWSNIPLKFSVILWMHWGPSSSHYFLYQAQGIHWQHQTKLVKPCPYYNLNFTALSNKNSDLIQYMCLAWYSSVLLCSLRWKNSLKQTSVFRSGTTGDFICLSGGQDVAPSQQSKAFTATKLLGSQLF